MSLLLKMARAGGRDEDSSMGIANVPELILFDIRDQGLGQIPPYSGLFSWGLRAFFCRSRAKPWEFSTAALSL